MPAQRLDEFGATEHDPGLRAAEQLVPREADEVGAGDERLACRRLGFDRRDCTRSEVVDEWEPVTPRHGGYLLEPRPLLEADHAEVRLVDAQQDCRLRPDRTLVVRGARPIRRADLD